MDLAVQKFGNKRFRPFSSISEIGNPLSFPGTFGEVGDQILTPRLSTTSTGPRSLSLFSPDFMF
jgi:hypothetical protein